MSSNSYMELIQKLVSKQISPEEFERQTTGQKQYLLNLIHSILSGQISFTQFQDEYYRFVINRCSGFLSDSERQFFVDIQEKLDWTTEKEKLDFESIKYGWINQRQFLEWLQKEHDCFLKDNRINGDI